MIHLSLNFASISDLNRFFSNPLDYATLPGAAPIVAETTSVAGAATVTDIATKRGPGRPKKTVAHDAQPAVASNPGSPSAGSQEAPPPVRDGAVVEPVAVVADATPAAGSDVKAAPTLDDARTALSDFNVKFGMEKAMAFLGTWKVQRISALDPISYAPFIDAIRAAIKDAPSEPPLTPEEIAALRSKDAS